MRRPSVCAARASPPESPPFVGHTVTSEHVNEHLKMSATSPYRAPAPALTSTLVVPVLAWPRILVVFAVLFFAPIGLHVFLWSRVVTVHCARGAAEQIVCEVNENSIALSSRSQRSAAGAFMAELQGATHRSRGDTWIVLVSRQNPNLQLTSGFSGDKEGQAVAVATLTDFLRDRAAKSVTVGFGSRDRTAWIFGMIDVVAFLILYPLLGQRLRVTANRHRDELHFHRRAWPFPGTHSHVVYSGFDRVEVEASGKGRFCLVAVTKGGERCPLTRPIGAGGLLEKAAERVTAWVHAERSRQLIGEPDDTKKATS